MTDASAIYGQHPVPPQRGRGVLIALLAIVAVLIAAVVAGGVYLVGKRLLGSDSADRGGPVPGQLRGTFPTQPSVGWTLAASDIASGLAFVRPDPTSLQYWRPGFIDLGHTLITATYRPQSDAGLGLAAVDAKTGSIRWHKDLDTGELYEVSGLPINGRPTCATRTLGDELPCILRNFDGAFNELWYFKVSDGSVTRKIDLSEGSYSTVEVYGDNVYLLGYQRMSKGTRENPTAHWQRQFTASGQGCAGSGDSVAYGATDDLVYFGSTEGVIVASTDDGRQLSEDSLAGVRVFPGQGFIGEICRTRSTTQIVVFDGDGNKLRSEPERDTPMLGWGIQQAYPARPWLVSPGTKVPYILGDQAQDFVTGEELWKAAGSEVPDTLLLHAIIGDVVIGAHAQTDFLIPGVHAHDLTTGEQLWTTSDAYGSNTSSAMSDGQRVILNASDRGIAAINLATGQTDWRLSGLQAHEVSLAGDGFAAIANDTITYYPPTGGPSVAPGRVATEPATGGEGGLTTKCGRTPEMRPVEYRAEGGAMVVKMEIKATCPGGDTISTDRFRVTIRDDISTISSSVFDFSKDPLILPEGETKIIELTFGADDIWRLPSSLGDRSGGAIRDSETGITRAPASGNEIVDCEDEATGGGGNPGIPTQSARPKAPAERENCGTEEDALSALRAQVDADRPFVRSDLADRWVAQLSSKQPGLVAPDVDGGQAVTWNACEILRQHLRLRLKYPEVRLVWSDEWSTFDLRGWWVTFAGLTFPDADAANRWCDERSIPVDECFAKVISNNGDSRGSTKYRR